jgi:hypothetical protein
MKKIEFNAFINPILTIVATGIVTGLTTWAVTTRTYQDQTKTRYIDYGIQINSIFQGNRNISQDKIKVSIIGDNNVASPVKEISQVTLAFYNISDKDFEKIKLYIDFAPIKSDDKSFRIIAGEIKTEYRDIIKRANGKSSDDVSTRKFVYDIPHVNRSELQLRSTEKGTNFQEKFFKISPVFEVTYTIAGQQISAENIKIKIDSLGVQARNTSKDENSWDNFEEYKIFRQDDGFKLIFFKISKWLPIMILVIPAILYIASVYFYESWLKSKRKSKNINLIKEKLVSQKSLSQLHQILDPKDLSIELVNICRVVLNQKIDDKFQSSLVDKFSQINEIDEFKKLNESQVAEMLSLMYQQLFS